MRSRHFVGLAAFAASALSLASASAEAPARAHGASLWTLLEWLAAGLSAKLALPAAAFGVKIATPAVLLLALWVVLRRRRRDWAARRAPAPVASAPRYAPYALPARVAVALAAAARARR